MRLTLETAPSTAPVDLASAKHHCRVSGDVHDAAIEAFIATATDYLDGPSGILGRAIMPQTWLLELSDWSDSLVLPIEPIRAVTVTYFDADGVEQTLDPTSYELSAWPSRATELRLRSGVVRPELSAAEYPVRISMAAGYEDADAVPWPLKTAILMLVAHWRLTAESVIVGTGAIETPHGFDMLIARYRRFVG